MGDPGPDEIAGISQEDTVFLAEFLNTFDDCCEVDAGNYRNLQITHNARVHLQFIYDFYFVFGFVHFPDDRRRIKFNLERVGQYLENHHLQSQSRTCLVSEWKRLLAQNECLQNSGCVYEHHRELSLIQEHNNLRESINKIFEKPNALISLKFEMQHCFDICELSDTSDLMWTNFESFDTNRSFYTVAVDKKTLYYVEMRPHSEHGRLAKFVIEAQYPDIEKMSLAETSDEPTPSQTFPCLELLHFQYYNERIICMLCRYKKDNYWSNCFIQLPIDVLQAKTRVYPLRSRINIDKELEPTIFGTILDQEFMRALEMDDGGQIAVSGGRKIATILSLSHKKIHHYETEADDDDDLDEEGKHHVCEGISDDSVDEQSNGPAKKS